MRRFFYALGLICYVFCLDLPAAEPETGAGEQAQHGGEAAAQAAHHHVPLQAQHQELSQPDHHLLDTGRYSAHRLHLPG
jgi:hypothetical protein